MTSGLKNYGIGALSEFLEDRVVYRNLEPCDRRLPGLDEVLTALGLPAGSGIPRKTEVLYARAVAGILEAARRLEAPKTRLHSLVFLGDTHHNDGTAFRNLCQAGGWHGLAFIGSESNSPAAAGAGAVARTLTGEGLAVYTAQRWEAIDGIEGYCAESGVPVDEGLAVVVDLDKTALGARGRNAAPIDAARVAAVEATVAVLLGEAFEREAFRQAYGTLNQPGYHAFTRDNQDYLAYISLILGSGLIGLDDLLSGVHSEELEGFEAFIEEVETRVKELPPGLRQIHAEILGRVRAGDPTPFKAFRRNEYSETVRRMGSLAEGASISRLLAEEILITAEVRSEALRLAHHGALMFGLSDKPDEASLPSPELAREGYLPIHRTLTHIVGV